MQKFHIVSFHLKYMNFHYIIKHIVIVVLFNASHNFFFFFFSKRVFYIEMQ